MDYIHIELPEIISDEDIDLLAMDPESIFDEDFSANSHKITDYIQRLKNLVRDAVDAYDYGDLENFEQYKALLREMTDE